MIEEWWKRLDGNTAKVTLGEEEKPTVDVPSKYNKTYNGYLIDPYRIAVLYGVTNACQFHVIKKLLRAGYSEKGLLQEIDECIQTLQRWKQMLQEENNTPPPAYSANTGQLCE